MRSWINILTQKIKCHSNPNNLRYKVMINILLEKKKRNLLIQEIMKAIEIKNLFIIVYFYSHNNANIINSNPSKIKIINIHLNKKNK